jgi:hypothetical protein
MEMSLKLRVVRTLKQLGFLSALAAGEHVETPPSVSNLTHNSSAVLQVGQRLGEQMEVLFQVARELEQNASEMQELAAKTWDDFSSLEQSYYNLSYEVFVSAKELKECGNNTELSATIAERLLNILKANGLEAMLVKPGGVFDPGCHVCEAVEDNPNFEPGAIVEVLFDGFVHRTASNLRVIRPARVAVNRK